MAVTVQSTPSGHMYFRASYKGLAKSFHVSKLGAGLAESKAERQFRHWVANKDKIAEFKKSLEL